MERVAAGFGSMAERLERFGRAMTSNMRNRPGAKRSVDGDLAMPRRLAAHVIRTLSAGGRAPTASGDAFESLSSREEEVLQLLSRGLTDREIAEALTISPRTVETHVSNLLHKLGVRNRAEAARRYSTRG